MYYYICSQDMSDNTQANAIYSKANYNEADATLHYDMWYAEQQQNSNLVGCKCLILDENMNPVKKDIWRKPVVIEAEVEQNTEE